MQIRSWFRSPDEKKAAVVSQGGLHVHVVTWLACRTFLGAIVTEHDAEERRLQQAAARPSFRRHGDMWIVFTHGMSLDGLYG